MADAFATGEAAEPRRLGQREAARASVEESGGELIAGLSLSTPSERFNPDWAPLVRETADEISRALGHLSPKA